jgi:4-carboxymuconolactone decarboxylase
MTIPSRQYHKIKQRHPDYLDAVEALGIAVKNSGPIVGKHAQLIQLAAAAATRSEGAVHSHTRRAIEAGALEEEIYHAIILTTSTIGFPSVVAAISWADDVINDRHHI